jgi:hypothetical protein
MALSAGTTATLTATMTPLVPTATVTPVPATETASPTSTPIVPTLVIHNQSRTVVGGRTATRDLAGNTNGGNEPGREIVSSVFGPGATVTYTLTYPDKST